MDMRHFSPGIFEKFKRVIPRTMTFWHELGVDPSKQFSECTPYWAVSSSSGQGGVKVDGKGKTNIAGLFAAGAVARSLAQGIYAVGGVATSLGSSVLSEKKLIKKKRFFLFSYYYNKN